MNTYYIIKNIYLFIMYLVVEFKININLAYYLIHLFDQYLHNYLDLTFNVTLYYNYWHNYIQSNIGVIYLYEYKIQMNGIKIFKENCICSYTNMTIIICSLSFKPIFT